MGNVYYQQKEWKEAIKYFDKSLTEHRNAEVLKKQAVSMCVYTVGSVMGSMVKCPAPHNINYEPVAQLRFEFTLLMQCS